MDWPSFFKVLVPDFKSTLRIPPLFGKTFEHLLPESALLQTKSGETWSVKIERIDERYYFTDGWSKFVKDHDLQMGEFLVFWLMLGGKDTTAVFKVATYGITGCDKDLNSATASDEPTKFEPGVINLNLESTRNRPTKLSNIITTKGSRRGKSRKVENEKRGANGAQISDDSVDDPIYFIQVLKKHHRYRMPVPMGFANKTGVKHKSEMVLQNLNGGSWRVGLKLYGNSMLYMGKGWPEFRKKNRLTLGNRYAFEFIPETDSIQVQLLRKRR